MDIYEVILADRSEYETYEISVGLFDSADKAEEAKKKIEELIEKRKKSHFHVSIIEGRIYLNELDKTVLKYWDLLEEE